MTALPPGYATGQEASLPTRLILAIDHGSSGVRTALCTARGEVLAFADRPTPTERLPDGGVEQDPMSWWAAFLEGAREVLTGAARARVVAVACSSTFSTTVACAADGTPVAPALSWQDARGAPYVRRLVGGPIQGYGARALARWYPATGGAPTLSGKDDAAHLLFWKHARPEVFSAARWFLGSKDWFNLMLSGRAAASFDSAALFWLTDNRDARDVRYLPRLARALGVDVARLGPLVPAPTLLGPLRPEVAAELGLPEGVAVVAGAADLQSACVGSGAVRDFEAHLYLGTSSWLLCHLPFRRTDPLHAIASLPAAIPGRWIAANEQDSAGACLDWLGRLLFPGAPLGVGAPDDLHARLDAAAAQVAPGAGGVLFTPWLNGEKTPVDDEKLRGGFHNLGLGSGAPELVRAVYEGVAYNTRWLLGPLERLVGRRLDPIRVIGGGARSDVWCQILADVLDRPLHRVVAPRQANARGAALIAAVALGEIAFAEVPALVPVEARFLPAGGQRALHDERFTVFQALHRENRGILHRLNRR
ncbi:MAG: FGGY-family carbohydrate kinase [Pseudomonadota bacterium]